MKTTLTRFAIVLIAFLAAVEILERLSPPRPESWNERGMLLVLGLTICALIWSVRPAFEGFRKPSFQLLARAALFLGFLVSTWAAASVYSWHLRPNLGWYEEPHWVARHEVFQRQLRARIERNLW